MLLLESFTYIICRMLKTQFRPVKKKFVKNELSNRKKSKNGRKMVENCDGKLRALGIYRTTAHFARKMVGKWRHIREETKRKMALLKRKTRLGQLSAQSQLNFSQHKEAQVALYAQILQ